MKHCGGSRSGCDECVLPHGAAKWAGSMRQIHLVSTFTHLIPPVSVGPTLKLLVEIKRICLILCKWGADTHELLTPSHLEAALLVNHLYGLHRCNSSGPGDTSDLNILLSLRSNHSITKS